MQPVRLPCSSIVVVVVLLLLLLVANTMGLLKLFVAEEPLAVNMGFHAKRRMATKHLPAANKFNGTSLLLLLVFVTIYFTGSLNSASPTIFLCPASHISPMHAAAVVVAIYVCA